jgi:hypothetical protein
MNMDGLLLLVRSLEKLSDEVVANTLAKLSAECCQELTTVLGAIEKAQQRFECPICHRQYDRKWNRDRHVLQHEKDASHSCLFEGCTQTFSSSLLLVEHFATVHDLDMKSTKRARTVVRHNDHFDLLLPSGSLLHMGENGMLEHALEPSLSNAVQLSNEHSHQFVGKNVGQPVKHGDHFDVLLGDELHCDFDACSLLHSRELDGGCDWDDFLDEF